MNKPDISVVCPCHNEQDVIPRFFAEIEKIFFDLPYSYEIIFINDGSTDTTLDEINSLSKIHKQVRVINLSRNFGKEAALTAGLDLAKGEAIIPIDADLQDPPELIRDFIREWQKGFDVVVAKRVDRSTDTFSKRVTANLFYRFHNSIAHPEIPDNVGDFRLISRRVVTAIQLLPENQRFMKGIFSWVGFKTSVVEYTRQPRAAGETSFNGWRLWNFALEGITSFSTAPLRIWLYLGVIVSLIAFVYGSAIIIRTMWHGVDLPGYASILSAVLFFGGIQLIGLGVMGEYIGRIYMETKGRPVYIVESDSDAEQNDTP
ncbi:glycosyltransferase family 2 protein [Enterovibrio sp. ZSDZ35]|uniref:Glycosyltransferase family 2 protein n=1 Tax=Enterovibrio qingdaonensis TaxID=2899818 RepID=A0ABT5QN07_9GAMM|nr:glycosyltransferase family 2 protein [Enterovibrio sp. ZSDZ35]MDD1782058.1 glycosyltransferase family 2 protein [Enterovibrio sp. ZSDZ35]